MRCHLYGPSEAGDAWAARLRQHLRLDLEMITATGDLILFMHMHEQTKQADGLACSYVNDILYTGEPEFKRGTSVTARTSEVKKLELTSLDFAGLTVQQQDTGYSIDQSRYAAPLKPVDMSSGFEEFRENWHQLAWMSNSRPDVSGAVEMLSQVTINSFN